MSAAESMPEPERMTLWSHRRGRPIAQHCLTLFLWLLSVEILFAQDPSDETVRPVSPSAANIEQRIYELEQRQSELVEQNRLLSRRLQELSSSQPQRSLNGSDPNGAFLPPAPQTASKNGNFIRSAQANRRCRRARQLCRNDSIYSFQQS